MPPPRRSTSPFGSIEDKFAQMGERGRLSSSTAARRLSARAPPTSAAISADAGIPDDFSPHVLRHCFGTTLVRDCHDLVLVAELMGHARLETTRAYALPTAADRQRAINSLPTDR